MSDTTTTITPEERAAIRSPSERWDALWYPHDRCHKMMLRLLTALEAAEARAEKAEDYAEKLVYAVTDGNLSNSYDVQVVADEVSRIWQSYTNQKVAAVRAEAEAERDRLRERLEAALDKTAEIQDEWESEGVCHACGICAGIPYEWQRPDWFCCRVALGLWIEGKPLPWEEAARRAVAESEVGK